MESETKTTEEDEAKLARAIAEAMEPFGSLPTPPAEIDQVDQSFPSPNGYWFLVAYYEDNDQPKWVPRSLDSPKYMLQLMRTQYITLTPHADVWKAGYCNMSGKRGDTTMIGMTNDREWTCHVKPTVAVGLEFARAREIKWRST